MSEDQHEYWARVDANVAWLHELADRLNAQIRAGSADTEQGLQKLRDMVESVGVVGDLVLFDLAPRDDMNANAGFEARYADLVDLLDDPEAGTGREQRLRPQNPELPPYPPDRG